MAKKVNATQAYLLENAPRALIQDSIAKCKAQDPPRSLRYQILELLKQWTYGPSKGVKTLD